MQTDNESMKTMTIMEFRYWLEGVEEMQPEGWSPDKRQWDRIREKIDSITVGSLVPVPQQAPAPVSVSAPPPAYNNQPIQHAQSGMGRVVAPQPNGVLFGNADNPAFPIKTPNIDSSSKPYEPAFI
jgi:hypothetical protein